MHILSFITAFLFARGFVNASPASFSASSVAASSSLAASSGAASSAPVASSAAPLSLPPAAASAIAAPAATVTADLITTTQQGDCLEFTENHIKFHNGLPISGHSWLKLCKDGYYDTYGILRNDGNGESYNVAWWWKVTDIQGRNYYFGSDDKCGPFHPLQNKGDICEWSQNFQYNYNIQQHWHDLKYYHKAKGYPIVY